MFLHAMMRRLLPSLVAIALALPATGMSIDGSVRAGGGDAEAVIRVEIGESVSICERGIPCTSWEARVLSGVRGLRTGDSIILRELGGEIGGRGVVVSGIPRYQRGEIIRARLIRNADGSWRAWEHERGITRITGQAPTAASARMVRPAATDPAAWLLTGESAGTSLPVRHDRFSLRDRLEFVISGNSATYPNARALIDRAMQAWNDDAPSHVFTIRGGDATAPYAVQDGMSAIVLDDPIEGADPSVVGQTFIFYRTVASNDGRGPFYAIDEVDIALRARNFPSGALYLELLTHELGHALGFRHANEGTPASSDSVMNSSLSGRFGASLGSWDRDALADVYPQLTPECSGAPISVVASSASVKEGGSVTVSAGVPPGTAVQWFRGSRGDRSNAIGAGTELTLTNLREPVRVWALATNGCAFANSPELFIDVAVCHAITIFEISPSRTVAPGSSVDLDVQHGGEGPFTYTWYRGEIGDVSHPVGSARSIVSGPIATTTSFWVRIENDCTRSDAGPVRIRVEGSKSRRRGAPHPVAAGVTRQSRELE